MSKRKGPQSSPMLDAFKAAECIAEGKTLPEMVLALFEILEVREVSDSGREFSPTTISSCRILDGTRLNYLLPALKQAALDAKSEGLATS